MYDVEHVDEQEPEAGGDEPEGNEDGITLKEWIVRVDAILEPALGIDLDGIRNVTDIDVYEYWIEAIGPRYFIVEYLADDLDEYGNSYMANAVREAFPMGDD